MLSPILLSTISVKCTEDVCGQVVHYMQIHYYY